MFDGIDEARSRGGGPASDRPSEVEEALSPSPMVGFNEGAALVPSGSDDPTDHSHYPRGDSLFQPNSGPTLVALSEHDLVNTLQDLAEELGEDIEQVEKAAELFGLDLPERKGFEIDVEPQAGVIEIPLAGRVDIAHLRDPVHEDSRVLHHLYVACGMDTEEIAAYLSDQLKRVLDGPKRVWHVTPNEVHRALIEVGLIEGGRADDGPMRLADDDIRLGGPTHRTEEPRRKSRGLTFRAEDYE